MLLMLPILLRRVPFLFYFPTPFAVVAVCFHHRGNDRMLVADMVHHERGHSLPCSGREQHIARAAKISARHRFHTEPRRGHFFDATRGEEVGGSKTALGSGYRAVLA